MVARCLPQGQYFDFVDMLFATQEDWAYDPNFLQALESKAADVGMSKATFKACVDNKALQEGIINRLRATQAQWEINSTPSFVVNNKNVISGALALEDFIAAVEGAANEEAPSTEPAEPSE